MKTIRSVDKAAWKVLSPPPDLPIDRADALLEGWRGGRHAISVEPLDGGIMNWNYCVRFSGAVERYVLRFYDRQPASCAKEVGILERIRGDVPVPHVLHAVTGGAAGYPPFCVLEFIDGISFRTLRRQGDVQGVADASYDAGRLLPRLARHRFERAGLLSSSLEIDDSPFTDASLAEIVEHFAASPLFRQRVSAPLLTRVLEFARINDDRFTAAAPEAMLVHGDFNSPNILVRQERGSWRVAAILDWEFAFAGSIFCDIGNMLRYERPGTPRYEPHFSHGLIDGGWQMPDDWFLLARLADLPALCDLLTRDDVPDAVVEELCDLLEGATSGF